jgi:DNA modification methylase
MTPWLDDGDVRLFHGDALACLREMPTESVQMILTSPPFYGLRDYGTGRWEGGDPDCGHVQSIGGKQGAAGKNTLGRDASHPNRETLPSSKHAEMPTLYRRECRKCGAVRVDEQIGLEATPGEWVTRLVDVLREARRVLRKDGLLWIEVGDSYTSGGRTTHGTREGYKQATNRGTVDHEYRPPMPDGLKQKDLVGAPWMLAMALRADGWYLRSDTIWNRPNPMPESVTDRPTRSHSYVFLLTRSRDYFYDQEAVREPVDVDYYAERAGGNLERAWPDDMRGKGSSEGAATGRSHGMGINPAGRNMRSVWTITTGTTEAGHYATMPPALAERCIKAGSSEHGACATCGAPWRRVLARGESDWARLRGERTWEDVMDQQAERGVRSLYSPGRSSMHTLTENGTVPSLRPRGTRMLGWRPTCKHYDHRYAELPRASNARKRRQQDAAGTWWARARKRPGSKDWPVTPCVVLDPFAGTGTTAHVARTLGRDSVGIELSEPYLEIAWERLSQQKLFA